MRAPRWHTAKRGAVHSTLLDYVQAVEDAQADIFERFVRLEILYDPNGPTAREMLGGDQRGVTENVVASNIDTVHAAIASTGVRSRFPTDGGDWSDQRTARHLEWYIEGVAKLAGRAPACRTAFKAAAKKGTGLVKVYVDTFDQVRVDHVLVDDVIVDEKQCRNGAKPRELHQRCTMDRDELAAMFPKLAAKIEQLPAGGGRVWSGYRTIEDHEVIVIESWRLPIGRPGMAGYRPGRHTIVADGLDLLDEEWIDQFFPFAKIVWTERDAAYYGISLAERIAGHQRALNRRNLQIERALDLHAFPTTYVRQVDAGLGLKTTTNRVGHVVTFKGEEPKTVTAPAVSGETYQSREDLKRSADEESGVNRMASHGTKPAGLDSGAALREYRDQTTQRFAPQEQAFEQLNLDTDWLILHCCKRLGSKAPEIMRDTKFGARRMKWSDVDMGDVRVQIVAASTLPRTPSGRSQLVLEWAQAGIISMDSAKRLVGHPDLEKELSLYTAALESIEHAIEEIEDGHVVMPEPFDNHAMCVWRGQQRYLQIATLGAPEEILEALRQYVVNAAWMIAQRQRAANGNAAAAGDPGAASLDMPADPMANPAAPTGMDPAAAMAPAA